MLDPMNERHWVEGWKVSHPGDGRGRLLTRKRDGKTARSWYEAATVEAMDHGISRKEFLTNPGYGWTDAELQEPNSTPTFPQSLDEADAYEEDDWVMVEGTAHDPGSIATIALGVVMVMLAILLMFVGTTLSMGIAFVLCFIAGIAISVGLVD